MSFFIIIGKMDYAVVGAPFEGIPIRQGTTMPYYYITKMLQKY